VEVHARTRSGSTYQTRAAGPPASLMCV
jgi:hypothetical protein